MESVLDSNLNQEDLQIKGEIKVFLKEAARWAKIIAIIAFVMFGIIVIASIVGGVVMSKTIPDGGAVSAFSVVFYIVLFGVFMIPYIFLFRFAKHMKIAIAQKDQQSLHTSFSNLKTHYFALGIMMIIGVVFYVMILIGLSSFILTDLANF